MAAEKIDLANSKVTKNELYMNYNNALALKKKLSTQLNKISATLNKLNKVLNKAITEETVKGSATWVKTIKTASSGCSMQAKRATEKNKRLENKFNNDSLQFLEEVLGGKYGQVDLAIGDLSQKEVENLEAEKVEKILTNANIDTSTQGQQVADYATQFIGNKYVYGGNDLNNGTDCSGFTQQVFKQFGVDLPHSSSEQLNNASAYGGQNIGTDLTNAEPGDIIAYEGHVGIYIGDNQIVNASNSKSYENGGGIRITNADYRPVKGIVRYINS